MTNEMNDDVEKEKYLNDLDITVSWLDIDYQKWKFLRDCIKSKLYSTCRCCRVKTSKENIDASLFNLVNGKRYLYKIL